jgi:hypothetical protein
MPYQPQAAALMADCLQGKVVATAMLVCQKINALSSVLMNMAGQVKPWPSQQNKLNIKLKVLHL